MTESTRNCSPEVALLDPTHASQRGKCDVLMSEASRFVRLLSNLGSAGGAGACWPCTPGAGGRRGTSSSPAYPRWARLRPAPAWMRVSWPKSAVGTPPGRRASRYRHGHSPGVRRWHGAGRRARLGRTVRPVQDLSGPAAQIVLVHLPEAGRRSGGRHQECAGDVSAEKNPWRGQGWGLWTVVLPAAAESATRRALPMRSKDRDLHLHPQHRAVAVPGEDPPPPGYRTTDGARIGVPSRGTRPRRRRSPAAGRRRCRIASSCGGTLPRSGGPSRTSSEGTRKAGSVRL